MNDSVCVLYLLATLLSGISLHTTGAKRESAFLLKVEERKNHLGSAGSTIAFGGPDLTHCILF